MATPVLPGDEGDTFMFYRLLDAEPESILVDAIRAMDGVTFLHGPSNSSMCFKYALIEPEVQEALRWAANPVSSVTKKSLAEELEGMPIQHRAAVRCWTGNACYPLTSLFRKKNRTLADIKPVLPYAKLLITGLRCLPEGFIKTGTVYRGEGGVSDRWDEKMQVDSIIQWFTPLSFSLNPAVLRKFMSPSSNGARTMFTLEGASGYNLRDFSLYQDGDEGEDEVLMECVSRARVISVETFTDSHPLVRAGQVPSGLHTAKLQMCPGIDMLTTKTSLVMERLQRTAQEEEELRKQSESAVEELRKQKEAAVEELKMEKEAAEEELRRTRANLALEKMKLANAQSSMRAVDFRVFYPYGYNESVSADELRQILPTETGDLGFLHETYCDVEDLLQDAKKNGRRIAREMGDLWDCLDDMRQKTRENCDASETGEQAECFFVIFDDYRKKVQAATKGLLDAKVESMHTEKLAVVSMDLYSIFVELETKKGLLTLAAESAMKKLNRLPAAPSPQKIRVVQIMEAMQTQLEVADKGTMVTFFLTILNEKYQEIMDLAHGLHAREKKGETPQDLDDLTRGFALRELMEDAVIKMLQIVYAKALWIVAKEVLEIEEPRLPKALNILLGTNIQYHKDPQRGSRLRTLSTLFHPDEINWITLDILQGANIKSKEEISDVYKVITAAIAELKRQGW